MGIDVSQKNVVLPSFGFVSANKATIIDGYSREASRVSAIVLSIIKSDAPSANAVKYRLYARRGEIHLYATDGSVVEIIRIEEIKGRSLKSQLLSSCREVNACVLKYLKEEECYSSKITVEFDRDERGVSMSMLRSCRHVIEFDSSSSKLSREGVLSFVTKKLQETKEGLRPRVLKKFFKALTVRNHILDFLRNKKKMLMDSPSPIDSDERATLDRITNAINELYSTNLNTVFDGISSQETMYDETLGDVNAEKLKEMAVKKYTEVLGDLEAKYHTEFNKQKVGLSTDDTLAHRLTDMKSLAKDTALAGVPKKYRLVVAKHLKFIKDVPQDFGTCTEHLLVDISQTSGDKMVIPEKHLIPFFTQIEFTAKKYREVAKVNIPAISNQEGKWLGGNVTEKSVKAFFEECSKRDNKNDVLRFSKPLMKRVADGLASLFSAVTRKHWSNERARQRERVKNMKEASKHGKSTQRYYETLYEEEFAETEPRRSLSVDGFFEEGIDHSDTASTRSFVTARSHPSEVELPLSVDGFSDDGIDYSDAVSTSSFVTARSHPSEAEPPFDRVVSNQHLSGAGVYSTDDEASVAASKADSEASEGRITRSKMLMNVHQGRGFDIGRGSAFDARVKFLNAEYEAQSRPKKSVTRSSSSTERTGVVEHTYDEKKSL